MFEQRTVETSRKAIILGAIVSMVMAVAIIAIVFSYERPEKGHQMAGDDMGALSKPKDKSEAPAVTPPEAPAPAAEPTP